LLPGWSDGTRFGRQALDSPDYRLGPSRTPRGAPTRAGADPDHIERAVTLYASGLSCTSIGKELNVNPETVRQALLKAGVAMRRPGRPRAMES
jgi:hypothetical protein